MWILVSLSYLKANKYTSMKTGSTAARIMNPLSANSEIPLSLTARPSNHPCLNIAFQLTIVLKT